MKLVIDIPKEGYKRVMDGKCEGNDLTSYIKDGTPLPKRILSVDLIIETLCPKDEDYDYPCIAPSYLEEELERLLLDDTPTIIEADNAESEETNADSN